MAKYPGRLKAKGDPYLKGVFNSKPSVVKHVLNKMVALHKEAVTEGLAVFQHNAEPMISISSKGSKFSGFTPRQHEYVVDVITDAVHAKIAWACLKEVDPIAFKEARDHDPTRTPMVEAVKRMREEPGAALAEAPPYEEEFDGSEPGFVSGLPFEEDLDEPTATTNNANWGMF